MMTTTDPLTMTPEERRAEVAAIFAAGLMRVARRPSSLPNPQDKAENTSLYPSSQAPPQAGIPAEIRAGILAGISRN